MTEQKNLTQEELDAAELESIVPMPEDLIPLRQEKLALDAQLEVLEARKKEIQEIFGKRLDEMGKVGFILHGKVHARVSQGTRSDIDKKKLKEQMPHIYAQFLKVIKYRSIRIS